MRYFHDSYGDPYDHRHDDLSRAVAQLEDRVTHLVFVDGRLVDHWSEPVIGTRWQRYAERFDRERRPPPPPPPAPPSYEQALRWLDGVCGDRAAVLALGAEPLEDDGRDLPEAPTRQEQHRLAEVAELLDGVASVRFDAEAGHALRRALLAVWEADRTVVMHAPTADRAAGAIAWVVAKANGLLHPQGTLRIRDLQDGLGLRSSPSAYGRVVQHALVGFRDPSPLPWRPAQLPDLLPVGHPDLLLGSVRARLVRVRDQALRAQQASAA